MLNRRIWTLLLPALLIVALLGGCVVPPPPTTGSTAPEADGPTTITWAMWGSPAEVATHQAVADAFMAEHPDIRVEIMSEPWGDYFTKMQTLWASGDASQIPDVLFLSPIIQYAANGVLENLDPYIEASGYDLNDFWPALLEYATYEGSVYGFPRDISVEVLYYNKDIFDAAGLTYPDDTWTWDDLTAAAEALTVREGNQITRHGLGMEGGKYLLWVNQNGGSILDDMRNPSSCTLAEPEAVEAIQFFADMMNSGAAMRSANLSQAGGDAAVFASGQAAMIIQNASRISGFNDAGLNYDVAPVPYPAGGRRSATAAGAAWTMSAAANNKDAAWTFLNWLQSTNGGQRLYTLSGEIVPALRSTATSDAFLGLDSAPANRMAFVTEAENGRIGRQGYFPQYGEMNSSIVNPVMEQIWVGDAQPADVLPGACTLVDDFLADNGYPK
jgi:multiple sugar transport system substrate-binding protein